MSNVERQHLASKHGMSGRTSDRQHEEVALITGGAQGIGLAVAWELARQGLAVVLADLNQQAAQKAVERLTEAGHVALALQTDVADAASWKITFDHILKEFGTLTALVNNAGIAGRAAPLTDVAEEEWNRVLEVDLKGVYLGCRTVLPHMLERKRGAIVNVASIAGKEGNPNMVPYSAAKAGVIGLTKALAKEVAQTGIRVNAVAPAVIETPILEQLTEEQVAYMKSRIPMGRFGKPEEVAAVIGFLLSDRSSFVTGQCYDVSGGRATY